MTPATAKPAPKPAPKKVLPPYNPHTYAEVGDVVWWFPGADPGAQNQCGIVTERGFNGILKVNVLNPNLLDFSLQDGVYPMSHPKAQEHGSGGWRHKVETIAVRGLMIDAGVLKWDGEKDLLVMTEKGTLLLESGIFTYIDQPPVIPPAPPVPPTTPKT